MPKMSTITFRQIECFLEICRDFHFSKAASRLGLTQPPLSRNIKELEHVIGTRLFDRSTKKVSLTPAGVAFLGEVYQFPIQVNRAIDSAQRAESGEQSTLRIGFVGALLGNALLDVIDVQRQNHPDTQLKLVEDSPVRLLDSINKKELDGVFLGLKPDKFEEGLGSLVWKKEPLFACVPKTHSLASAGQVTLGKLSSEKLIVLSSDVAPTYRTLVEQLPTGEEERFQNHLRSY